MQPYGQTSDFFYVIFFLLNHADLVHMCVCVSVFCDYIPDECIKKELEILVNAMLVTG